MAVEWLQQLQGAAGVGKGHHGGEPLPDWLWFTYVGVSMGLVAMAGLMSGLTLGLMSLDELDLEVLKRSGTEQEKRHARRITPVIANEHFLLVTLLLFNALAAEALPIFLDKLVDPVAAVLLSVTVVLVIGEILPQAVCRSYGLQVGSYSAWLVRLLMAVSSPISWPIGKLLDWLLGEEHSGFFRRAQLKALVGLHSSDEGLGGTLTADEISIITGALDLTSKTAWAAMTPLDKVFMLPSDRRLDEAALQEILVSGHSRVPVHVPGNRRSLLGLILVKELVLVDPDQGVTAGQLVSRVLPRLPADTPLYQLLRLFESGGSHMVALTKPQARAASAELPAGVGGGGGARSAAPTPQQQQQQQQLPKIRSGVIKAGDNMIYLEAQQSPRGPLLPWEARAGGAATPTASGASLRTAASAGGAPASPALVGAAPQDSAVWGQGEAGDPVGIITIEDVIEELLQQEIIDETDQYVDNLQVTRVDAHALTSNLPPRLRKAYAQQFTPRVGRLVAHHHHQHHQQAHALPSHPYSGGRAPSSGSWSHSEGPNGSPGWPHLHNLRSMYEVRRTYSNPATPLGGSPPGHHATPQAPGTPVAGSASSSSSAAAAGWRQQPPQPPPPGEAREPAAQQHVAAEHAGQSLSRHGSADGYVTYTIMALGPQGGAASGARRRSSDTGSDGGGGGGASAGGAGHHHAPEPGGSNHRHYGYFAAVREGVAEGLAELARPLLYDDEPGQAAAAAAGGEQQQQQH